MTGKLTKAYYVECGWCDCYDTILAGKWGLTKQATQKKLHARGWSIKKGRWMCPRCKETKDAA